MQRLTQKTTGFAHADRRETRKNDKVSMGYEVDIRRLGVMDKITIAIADDQEMTVEMLSNIVASQDDFVLAGTAGNGEEALDLVRRCKPQILLLDMIMPLVDGKEVMRQLQSDETISPDTKVIVVTAADRRALAEEMFALGLFIILSSLLIRRRSFKAFVRHWVRNRSGRVRKMQARKKTHRASPWSIALRN